MVTLVLAMMDVAGEISLLVAEIIRLGTPSPSNNNQIVTTFGTLFHDDKCANIFEALVGTLRAAKKRKIITYDGEMLLQGVHDAVEIKLLVDPSASAEA